MEGIETRLGGKAEDDAKDTNEHHGSQFHRMTASGEAQIHAAAIECHQAEEGEERTAHGVVEVLARAEEGIAVQLMEHQGSREQSGQLIEEIEGHEVRRQHRTQQHAFRKEEEAVVTALCPAVGHIDGGIGDREKPAHRNEYRHRSAESIEGEGEGEGLGHVPHGALRAIHPNGGNDGQHRNDGLRRQQGHFRLGDSLLFYEGTARTQQQGEQNQQI